MRYIDRKIIDMMTYEDALIFIEKAEAASQKREYERNSILEINGHCILIPGFRYDGVGIQAMVRICVMLLARQANATYVHVPFLKLAHQSIDPVGQSLTPEEWAIKWEDFLNFGEGEFHITNLTNAIEKATLATQLLDKDGQFGDPKDDLRHKLPSLVETIRSRDSEARRIWTFNLGICRQPRECQLFLDEEFVQILQKKFNSNGYIPEKLLYSEQYLNIAIHIRRGDVWDACQAGSKKTMHRNKLVSQVYYVELLQKLQNLFNSSPKPVRFHIFSDGQPNNFDRFTFTDGHEAFLKLESGLLIENIQFHLCHSTINTIYHMIKAPILIPGKSTFSVLAVILSNSYVFYEDEITEFYQYDLLEQYMEGNTRFIPLNERVEDRVVDVVETLTKSKLMD